MYKILFISVILSACYFPVNSQVNYIIPRIDAEVVFDGKPDESLWREAQSFQFTMHQPVYGKEPTERTECMMFFNDRYLHFGANLYYSDISLLSNVGKQRDYFSQRCDWFGILLDTFNDSENGFVFYTTPSGLRFDATIKNDASAGMEDLNLSWNTFWDVATTHDNEGWYVEMRIPVSSLRFQEEGGVVRMGLMIMRFIPKKNEAVTFPAIDPRHTFATWKASLAAPVEFRGLKPDRPVYLAPYLIGGIQQSSLLNDSETSYEKELTPKYDAGLDFKYGLTNNLTLDLTVNTDFAQVEADEQQINLTRFSLFFPEKRPFFLEKSDVFDFDLMGGNKLFYSRRIGLNKGEAVRILGGARITGRAGEWDIGILDIQTAAHEDLNSENFGVLRTKRSILNPYSYAGAMFTSRINTDGSYNLAYGLDAVIRMFGEDFLTVRWAQTFQDSSENKVFSADPSRLLTRWERRNQSGLSYDFLYTWSGTQFDPGVGFEVKENYYALRGIVKYGWIPADETTWLRRHSISHTHLRLYNNTDNSLETVTSMTGWEFESRGGEYGSVNFNINREIVGEALDFGQASVPEGKYDFYYLSATFGTGSRFNPGLELNAEAGQFYDGIKYTLALQPTWNVNPGLDINPTYRVDYVNFKNRDQSFTNHIVGIKALAMFSTKLSLLGYIQYNTAVNLWLANIRFRYNPREGNDFYIVYNEGINTNLDREIPTLPRSDSRAVLLKYTYTFGF
jgi:hypothetical protein